MTATRTSTGGLPPCDENGWCHSTGRYGAAVFHPGHSSICPRYIPNTEAFCTSCGVPINYSSHHPWCPYADPSPLAIRLAERLYETVQQHLHDQWTLWEHLTPAERQPWVNEITEWIDHDPMTATL